MQPAGRRRPTPAGHHDSSAAAGSKLRTPLSNWRTGGGLIWLIEECDWVRFFFFCVCAVCRLSHLSLCLSSCSVRRTAASGLIMSLSEVMLWLSWSHSASEASVSSWRSCFHTDTTKSHLKDNIHTRSEYKIVWNYIKHLAFKYLNSSYQICPVYEVHRSYLQLVMQISVCLQAELRAAVIIQSLRCSHCFQHHLIQSLLHTIPQLLGLNQPLFHWVMLLENRQDEPITGRNTKQQGFKLKLAEKLGPKWIQIQSLRVF